MLIIGFLKYNYKKILLCIIPFLLMIIFFYSQYNSNNVKIEKSDVKQNKIIKKDKNKIISKKTSIVDVKGAVNSPGVYEIESGKRIIDVINMAGGLRENADTSILNLSKKVEDEMLVIVYTNEELEKYKNKYSNNDEISNEINNSIICPDSNNDACISKNSKKKNNIENNKLISINTATKEELMSLSGIGESKANSIIKYREEHGNFNSIEDIKKVSGIGDSLFEKIKDSITV